MRNKLTQERLREVLRYDPETGIMVWLKTLGSKAPKGRQAGAQDKHGYLQVRVDKRDYKVHRLAWFYMMGEWPNGDIDHINGIPGDNRWVNLRCVTHQENSQNRVRPRANSKSGVMGVYEKPNGFCAQITTNGKLTYLGRFATAEEAHAVYLAAKRKLHKGNTL